MSINTTMAIYKTWRTQVEATWQGHFGDEYTDRNMYISAQRMYFWQKIGRGYKPQSALEVGCNHGINLRYLSEYVDSHQLYGLDINYHALEQAREYSPCINYVWGSAFDLPFKDDFFDLVFTVGVLIHHHPDSLSAVMQEILRCSKHYVLAVEYAEKEFTEVPYRGLSAALFKGPYDALYRRMGLKLLETGNLAKNQGFDDCTYWMFSK